MTSEPLEAPGDRLEDLEALEVPRDARNLITASSAPAPSPPATGSPPGPYPYRAAASA